MPNPILSLHYIGTGIVASLSGAMTLFAGLRKRRTDEVARAIVKQVVPIEDRYRVTVECADEAKQMREFLFHADVYNVPNLGSEIEVMRPKAGATEVESASRSRLVLFAVLQLTVGALAICVGFAAGTGEVAPHDPTGALTPRVE